MIKLIDILNEIKWKTPPDEQLERGRLGFKDKIQKDTSLWQDFADMANRKQHNKFFKFFVNYLEKWEKGRLKYRLWPDLDDYDKDPRFELAFKLTLQEAMDNFKQLNDMLKKETDLMLNNLEHLFAYPPTKQEILDHREREEERYARLWFTEKKYPDIRIYTGKKEIHKSWKKMGYGDIKTWEEWTQEFAERMEMFE